MLIIKVYVPRFQSLRGVQFWHEFWKQASLLTSPRAALPSSSCFSSLTSTLIKAKHSMNMYGNSISWVLDSSSLQSSVSLSDSTLAKRAVSHSPVRIRILSVLINYTGSSAETVSLLVIGCVLLLSAGINEYFTTRSPIVPPRLFKVCMLSDSWWPRMSNQSVFFRRGPLLSFLYQYFYMLLHSLQAHIIYQCTFRHLVLLPQAQVSSE